MIEIIVAGIVVFGFYAYMFAVAAHMLEESWNEAHDTRRKEMER